MHFIIQSLGGLYIPFNVKNPEFGHTYGFGFKYSRSFFDDFTNGKKCNISVADYKSAYIFPDRFSLANSDIEEYVTKIAYNEREKWIFIYDNGFPEVGILFSRDSLEDKYNYLLDSYQADFIDSCSLEDENVYEYEKLLRANWLRLLISAN